jgi:hypothetical protein
VVSVAEVTAKSLPEKRFGFSKTNQVREFTRKSLVGESVADGEVEMTGEVVEEGGESEVVLGEHRDVLAGVWAVLGEEHSGPKVAGAVPEVEPQVLEVVRVVQGEVHKVREVRVNTVLRTKRPALATGGKGYRLLKTVVPKQGDDNLTFINGEVGPARPQHGYRWIRGRISPVCWRSTWRSSGCSPRWFPGRPRTPYVCEA